MKKLLFVCFFSFIAISVFAQRVYSVGVLPFVIPVETSEGIPGEGDAAEITNQVIARLSQCSTINLLQGEAAERGEYIISVNLSSQGDAQNSQIILGAAIRDASGRILNTYREEVPSIDRISVNALCTRFINYVPYPPYYLGKWQSTIDTVEGPVTCILEFLSNRTVRAIRYDTWEKRYTDTLIYHAFGAGSLTFTGYHFGLNYNVGGRQILADATFGISLTLEEGLAPYENISINSLGLLFNESKDNFELVDGGLLCGSSISDTENLTLKYTRFIKIQ